MDAIAANVVSVAIGPAGTGKTYLAVAIAAGMLKQGKVKRIVLARPAVEAGVRAVFGFPLQVGAVRLGALNLYRDRLGPLSDDQHADALVMASIAAQAVLMLQANAPPGSLAAELEAGADLHLSVHQAAGMVAAQLDVSVGQALIHLRAYAFGNDRPLSEVAEDVVARRLRFGPPSDGQDPGP